LLKFPSREEGFGMYPHETMT